MVANTKKMHVFLGKREWHTPLCANVHRFAKRAFLRGFLFGSLISHDIITEAAKFAGNTASLCRWWWRHDLTMYNLLDLTHYLDNFLSQVWCNWYWLCSSKRYRVEKSLLDRYFPYFFKQECICGKLKCEMWSCFIFGILVL